MKLIIVIFVLLLSTYVQAASHNYYFCGDNIVFDGECSICNKTPEGQIDFLLNKSESSVMARFYDSNGKVEGSRLYTNCKIFDEKNWDCSYEDDLGRYGGIVNKIKMVKNSFQSQIQQLYTNGNTRMIQNTCAKKRSWFSK